jgi:HD-GYP domain-containing protein (c-di-GMP phosphodiesterase class II)
MSGDPIRGRGAAGQPTGEQRMQADGLQVLVRLSALIRVTRSYQPDNQVVVRQIESFLELIGPMLHERGELVLVALESDLYINGVRIPVRAANIRFHQHVAEEFSRREIAGLRLTEGITTAELQTFFGLFTKPDEYSGHALLTACLGLGTDHIVPAIHASTEAPDDNFEYDLDAPGDEQEAPAAPGRVGGRGRGGGGRGIGGDGDGTGDASPGHSAPRGAARKNYSLAVQGARSLLTTTALQGGLELRHAKRVVQPLVDGAFSAEPVVVGLSTLTHHDEYTYAHAVNVCLVSVTMGHFLEMDRRGLADLGVAALLHDIGKAAVGRMIQNPLESFTEQDRMWAERHPVEGVKLLARSTTLNATTARCMRVALEHHLAADGSGYPTLGPEWRTSLLSRIVTVADCYVSLQTNRSALGTHVTPYQALGMMLGPLKSRFHPALLWALVQTVGFYPPGQLVELDDGAIAAVLAPNPKDLERPHVRVLPAPGAEPGRPLEYRPLPPERAIKRALRGDEYPPDPGLEHAAA